MSWLAACSNHEPVVLLPPCKELSSFLWLTCLGDFTRSEPRLKNLWREERKGKGERGVQPGVKHSGGVGALGWAPSRLSRSILDYGKAAGGFAFARITGREVWGNPGDSRGGQEEWSGIRKGSCQAQVGLMDSLELRLGL